MIRQSEPTFFRGVHAHAAADFHAPIGAAERGMS